MTDSIHSHLSFLQKKLSVKKTRYNKFANYHYRNAEDIVDALKPIMPEGVYITMTDEIVLIGDRYYLKSTASICFNGDTVSASAYAREPLEKKGSDVSQITGGCSTYSRRYALSGLLALDDGEDVDNHDNTQEGKPAPKATTAPPVMINLDQETEINDLLNEYGGDKNAFCQHFKVNNLYQLTHEQYKVAKDSLNRKIAKKRMGE